MRQMQEDIMLASTDDLVSTEIEHEGQVFTFAHDDENDHIFQAIKNSGSFYELSLLAALREYIAPDDFVIDIGANVGNHSIFFAGAVGCRVLAFEPNPRASRLLRHNIASNRLTGRVTVLEHGLGRRDIQGASLHARLKNNLGAVCLSENEPGDIEIKRLDSIALPQPPKLIKIDVEGMEADVIAGAADVLEAHRPVVCVEAGTWRNLVEVRRLLSAYGYIAIEAFNHTPTHILLADPSRSANEQTLDIVSRMASNLALYNADRATDISRDRAMVINEIKSRVAVLHDSLGQTIQHVNDDTKSVVDGAARSVADLTTQFAGLREHLSMFADRQDEETVELRGRTDAIFELTNQLSQSADATISTLEDVAKQIAQHKQVNGTVLREHYKTLTALAERLEEQDQRNSAALSQHNEALQAISSQLTAADDASASNWSDYRQSLDAFVKRVPSLDEMRGALHSVTDKIAQQIVDTNQIALREHGDALSTFSAQLCQLEDFNQAAAREHAAALDALAKDWPGRKAAQAAIEGLSTQFEQLDEFNQKALAEQRQAIAALDAASVQTRDQLNALTSEVVHSASAQAGSLRSAVTHIAEAMRERADVDDASRRDISDRVHSLSNQVHVELAATRMELAELKRLTARTLRRASAAAPGGVAVQQKTAAEPFAICFLNHQFASSWCGWRHHQAVQLTEGGHARINQNVSTPGVMSLPIATTEPGLYQVRADVNFDRHDTCRLFMRVTAADTGEVLGPDTQVTPGGTLFRFYQPRRIAKIQISLLVREPCEGYEFKLNWVRLERVDAEAHRQWISQQIGAPVIASLASIPDREPMLEDAVNSLLPQCDRVRVFLNNYGHVPQFLNHPRIDVRRSQDWDDNGDAGKFGWIEDNDPAGYRLTCDDDLLFPPDYALHMTRQVRATDNKAIVGLHGVILKQPIQQYYSKDSRYAIHFQTRLDQPRLAHVLGTGVLCFHSSRITMSRGDFMFRNMADIWVAKYAQEHDIPLLIARRPFKWVRQNTQSGGFESIYDHSLRRTTSSFNNAAIQDSVVKSLYPMALKKLDRQFRVLVVETDNPGELDACLESFHAHSVRDVEWVLVIAATGAGREIRDHIAAMSFYEECHTVDLMTDDGKDRLFSLLESIDYEIGFFATDRVRFHNTDWCTAPAADNWLKGADSLTFQLSHGEAIPTSAQRRADFAIFTKSGREILKAVRPTLQSSLFSYAGAHAAQRAPRFERPEDDVMTMSRIVRQSVTNAHPGGPPARARPKLMPARRVTRIEPKRINDVFDRVVVLNLDRRPDRWEAVSQQLTKAGITAQRFRAVDGTWPEIAAEFREYEASPLRELSQGTPRITSSHSFYVHPKSQAQRIAYLEERQKRKAIQSAGAWGYMRSMISILESAIEDGVENLLVFDDDVMFHNDTSSIFRRALKDLPDDWRILQLGTLQYHWDRKWIRWRGPHLYSSLGSSVGSHAVGIRAEVLPFMLERSQRLDLPYDVGPLSAAVQTFSDQSFVVYPNIAIQDVTESDIRSSGFQENADRERVLATYRWNMPDYAK